MATQLLHQTLGAVEHLGQLVADLNRLQLVRHLSRNNSKNAKIFLFLFMAILCNNIICNAQFKYSSERKIAVLGNGQTIVQGDSSGHLVFINSNPREITKRIKIHKSEICSVIASHDGKLLASSSSDGTIKITKIGHDDKVHSQTIDVRAFGSPDAIDRPELFFGYSVDFSSDDSMIAVSGGTRIMIWRIHDDRLQFITKVQRFDTLDHSVAFLGTPTTIAYKETIEQDNKIKYIFKSMDFKSKKSRKLFEVDNANGACSMRFDKNFNMIYLSTSHRIVSYDLNSGNINYVISDDDLIGLNPYISVSSDGSVLAVASSASVGLWDAPTGAPTKNLPINIDEIRYVEIINQINALIFNTKNREIYFEKLN